MPMVFCVAPRAGAWIEMNVYELVGRNDISRSPCGSVD